MPGGSVNEEALEVFDLLPGAALAYTNLVSAVQPEIGDALNRSEYSSDKQFLIDAADKGILPNLITRLKAVYSGMNVEASRPEGGTNSGAAAVDTSAADAANNRAAMPDFSTLLADSQLSMPVRLALERLASSGGDPTGGGLPTPLGSTRMHARRDQHQAAAYEEAQAPESMMDVLNSDIPDSALQQSRPPPFSFPQTSLPGPSFSSSFRGVSVRGAKWNAQIQHEGRKVFLGTFETEIEAAKAYDQAARSFHGTRALTNFDEHGNVIVAHLVHRYGVRPEHNKRVDASGQARKRSTSVNTEEVVKAVRVSRRRKGTDTTTVTNESPEQTSGPATPATLGTTFSTAGAEDSHLTGSTGYSGADGLTHYASASYDTSDAARAMSSSMTGAGRMDMRQAGLDATRSADLWHMSRSMMHPSQMAAMRVPQRQSQANGMSFTPAALMSALSSLLAPVAAASAMLNNGSQAPIRESPRTGLSSTNMYSPPAVPHDHYARPPTDLLSPNLGRQAESRRYDGMEILNLAVSKASAGLSSNGTAATVPDSMEHHVSPHDFNSVDASALSAFGANGTMVSPKMVESMRSSSRRPDNSMDARNAKRARYDYAHYENEEQV